MTIGYRGRYLIIVYEFGSCKTCHNHIERLWVPVAERELQKIARIAKKRKLQRTQQKREESDSS